MDKKRRNKFKYPLAVLGISSMVMLGAGAYGVGADEYDVLHTQTEDEVVENKDNLPKVRYMVVGGEPRNIEIDKKDELSYYINTTEDEFEIEGIEDVSQGGLDKNFEDVEEEFKSNSLLDYGNIGIYGEGSFVLDSEDLIGLEVKDNVSEHFAEYNEETGEYELLSQKYGLLPIEETEDADLAIVAFVEDTEDNVDVEDTNVSDTDKSNESDTTDTKGDDTTDSEEDNSSEEVIDDTSEGGGKDDEKSEEGKDSEEEEEYSEVDISKPAGNETFMGDVFTFGEIEEDHHVIFGTLAQISVLTEDIGEPLDKTTFYVENDIKTAQDLYNKFGIYNVSSDDLLLYREELDENGDGIMGNVPDKPVYNSLQLLKEDVEGEVKDEVGPDDIVVGNPGLGDLDEDDIDEGELTDPDFDIDEDKPDDWEDGNQEVAPDEDESGSVGDPEDNVEFPDWYDPDDDSGNDYEYDEDGNIIVPDDNDYEDYPEEEVDDTNDSDEPTEEEPIIEDEIIDDGMDEVIVGDEESNNEGEEYTGEEPTEEELPPIEDGNTDEPTGEDEVVTPPEEDDEPVEEPTEEEPTEEEPTEEEPTEEEPTEEDNTEEETTEENPVEEEPTEEPIEEEPTEEEPSGGESGIGDEPVSPEVPEDVGDTEPEPTIEEEIVSESDELEGVSRIGDDEVDVSMDKDGNIDSVRDKEGNLVLDRKKDKLELLEETNIKGVEGKSADDIEEEILDKGIDLITEEDEDEGFISGAMRILDSDDDKDNTELPDTGVNGTGFVVPLAISLIIIGGVGVFTLNRRKKK